MNASRALAELSSHPSPMATGLEKTWAKARIWARIALLARRAHGSWAPAARNLRRLVGHRRRYRGSDVARKYVRAAQRHFWDLYAPGFPSPAFDNYITRELERSNDATRLIAPPTVVLAITRRCPLACEHCCEWHTLNQAEAVSVADWAGIAGQFQELGSSQFFLSGGEPLSRLPAVFAILARVAAAADVWLLSSGVGLDAERANELKRAGLTGVIFSLDHWDAAEHDRFRGHPGAFDAAVGGSVAAHAVGLAVGLALVPTRSFLGPDALARYRELAERLGAGFLQLLEPKAVGRYEGETVELSAEQQRLLEAFAHATTFEAEHRRAPIVTHPDATRRASGCLGADRYVYVDTRGALHSCPFCRGGPALLASELDVASGLEQLRAKGCGRVEPGALSSNPQGVEPSHDRPRTSLRVL